MKRLLIILLCTAATGAQAASSFDALYEGVITIDQRPHKAAACPSETPTHIHVTGNSFKFHWGPANVVETIAADGTFSGSDGSTTLSGKIVGPSLEAFLLGEVCTYRIKATKS